MPHSKRYSVRSLALAGVFSALIFVTTAFTQIRLPFVQGGYYHAGDGVLMLCGLLFGWPLGVVIAALGSLLADIFVGAMVFAPATFVIKGVMALVVCLMLRQHTDWWRRIVASVLAGLFMVAGYWVYEVYILQIVTWQASWPDVLANCGQAGFGIALFLGLSPLAVRFRQYLQ